MSIGRIIAFPLEGTAYTEHLYAEARARGIEVVEGQWSSRWLMRELHRGDVVHIHWPSFLYHDKASRARSWKGLLKYSLMLSYAKTRGMRVVWTAHNVLPHDVGSHHAEHRIGRRITTHFADRVIAHGNAAREVVIRRLGVPDSRISVVRHGNWIDAYPNTVSRREARARLKVPASDFVYLFIGTCQPYKGLDTLIRTFGQLPGGSRLLIVGKFKSGAYRQQIEALLGEAPGIELHPGHVADGDLQYYLNAADCVVLPYRDILTSGAAMLALSFGRPVVAPDIGALRDHVNAHCGILYPAQDRTALLRALLEIRQRSLDPAAILGHARTFTWAPAVDILADLLDTPDASKKSAAPEQDAWPAGVRTESRKGSAYEVHGAGGEAGTRARPGR